MSEDIHKVTIVPRGRALGFMMSLPEEDRYVLSKDELEDWLKVTLAGRAAEQVVFGRITNGAANDLDRATAIARSMVFDWGMGATTQSQQVRADNYALSEETKRMRDREQREITDEAYAEAVRLISRHRSHLERLAQALLERETLDRPDIDRLLEGLEPESDASGLIGVALPDDDDVDARQRERQRRPGAAGAGVPRREAGAALLGRRRGRVGRLGVRGDLLGLGLDGLAASARRRSWRRISSSLAAIRERTSLTDATAESSVSAAFAPASWPSWWSRCVSRPKATSASFSSLFRLRSWIWSLARLGRLLGLVDDGGGDVGRLLLDLVEESHSLLLLLVRGLSPPTRMAAACERWRCIISGTPCWTWTPPWRVRDAARRRCEHREVVPEQGVEAASMLVGSDRIELLAALGEDTPVGRFLAKRGQGMHHIATGWTASSRRLADAAAAGYELIDETPRIGLFGLRVAFIHPESADGVLVELVEPSRNGAEHG